MEQANLERLENWRQLQELAGLLDKKKPAQPTKPQATPAGTNGNGVPPGYGPGTKIKYSAGPTPVTDVVSSMDPVILSLDDNTELQITVDLLQKAIAQGVVAKH